MLQLLSGSEFFSGGESKERRFSLRKRQLLEECEVSVDVFRGMLKRLRAAGVPQDVRYQTRRDGITQKDYDLSNAPVETPLGEFARVSNAAHRIEDCLIGNNSARQRGMIR